MPETARGDGRFGQGRCGLHRAVRFRMVSKAGNCSHIYADSGRPHGPGDGSRAEAMCTKAWENTTAAQKPTRRAAQLRVLSPFSPSQPPGSNLIPVVESIPPRKKTRGRSRGKMQGVLFLLPCPVSISSAYAPCPGRRPPKLTLWGKGQTAGQSVIRAHLVSGVPGPRP